MIQHLINRRIEIGESNESIQLTVRCVILDENDFEVAICFVAKRSRTRRKILTRHSGYLVEDVS